MKKSIKKISLALAAVLALAVLAGCANLDVVGKESASSFKAVLDTLGDKVTTDEMTGGWKLPAPDGGASFLWVPDYSTSALHDVMLVFDAKPFLDAGLDVTKLPESYTVAEDKIMIGTKLGSDAIKYNGAPTPLASYEELVKRYPKVIGYHTALGHFGVTVAEGSLFEWAKDMGTNDKDIVFVLNPEPLISAGVKPEAVKGWIYAKVPVDINGKPTEVYKFLKPFNLK
jgi:hypothetical protein